MLQLRIHSAPNPRFQAAEDALGVARRAELPFHVLRILTKLHDFFALVRRTHERADEETTERDRADSHLPRHHRRQEEIVCADEGELFVIPLLPSSLNRVESPEPKHNG